MNIVILDASTLKLEDRLSEFKQFGDLSIYDKTQPSETVSRSENAEIVLTNKVVFDKKVIDQLPNLKLICITATGMNNVDLEYAKSKGITVKNVAGYSTSSVAQVTISMLLKLISGLDKYDDYVKSEQYVASPIFTNIMNGFPEIKGKTWGIIGMGNIGREVAKIADAFGAKVVFSSISGSPRKENYIQVELKELLSTCDIISIHSPLNDKTLNLISEKELKLMKNSAILINVARGGIVNENDLVNALNSNEIAAAGVDVFSTEPMTANSPYLNVKDHSKIVFTPHIAWASDEARNILMDKLIGNVREFINNYE